MGAHLSDRARHSVMHAYSLAMPSSARRIGRSTAARAQVLRSAGFFMDASSPASSPEREEASGIHRQGLERRHDQARVRDARESTTAGRRWGISTNQLRGFTMGQLHTESNRSTSFYGAIRPPSRMSKEVVEKVSDVGAMRYAAQHSELDDYEIADQIDISHGYMSKVLKGTAGLYGKRLVRYMRVTKSIAPLQWLGDQMGCDVIERHSMAAQLAEAQAHVESLKQRLGS